MRFPASIIGMACCAMIGKMVPGLGQNLRRKVNGIGHCEEMTWCGQVADESRDLYFPGRRSALGREGAGEKPEGSQDSSNQEE